MDALARLIASGLGLGRAPVAPGSVASGAAALAALALLAWGGRPALALAAAAAALGGWWATARAVRGGAARDPGWVVIDEIAGQWIALLPLRQPHWPAALVALGLFRLFDIAKPGPIGWIDRRDGALAVLGDDIVAGGLAALLLLLLAALRPHWLAL